MKERDYMIWQIMMSTKYIEEALEKMTDEELEELYKVKVGNQYE
ncbi:hypothetical protein [Lederbergia citrisecunda]|nr:hypothetical protein [Lederbergia citrisecunda]